MTSAQSPTAQHEDTRPAPDTNPGAGPWGELRGRAFAKGHGTGNDFVLLTDPHAELALDA